MKRRSGPSAETAAAAAGSIRDGSSGENTVTQLRGAVSPVTGGERVTLTGITATPSGVPQTGYLWGPDELFEDIYELTINYDRIIDLTRLTSSISAGSYLKISGVITATYDPNGAPLVGSESAPIEEVGTGVYMTLAKEPTLVAAGGQLATLPRNEAWLHEWDSYWVEVWVATDQLDGVGSAKVDLLYDSEYFTATQIDHAGTFNQAATGSLKTDGVVAGLGGSTALAGMGTGGYALLGRVKFESIGDDGVDINLDDLVLGHPREIDVDDLRAPGVPLQIANEGRLVDHAGQVDQPAAVTDGGLERVGLDAQRDALESVPVEDGRDSALAAQPTIV